MSVFFKKTKTVLAFISQIYLDNIISKSATISVSVTNISVS